MNGLLLSMRRNWQSVLAAVVVVAAMNFLVMNYIQDDGYITFHYADNFVKYGTLYYNPGSVGPIGYSNPLYVVVLIVLRLLTLKEISFAALSRIIASLSLGAIFYMEAKALARATAAGNGAFVIVLLFQAATFVVFPYLMPNFFSGLETGLFTLLVFTLLWFLFICPMNDKWFLACLAAALALRFDSAITLSPIMVMYVVAGSTRKRLLWTTGVVGAVALFYVFHSLLVGSVIPLSFGHKSQAFSLVTLSDNVRVAAIILLPAMACLIPGRGHARSKAPVFSVAYALFLCLFYAMFVSWMFERYMFPFLFAIFAVALVELFRLWKQSLWAGIALLGCYMLTAFIPGTLGGFSWVSGYRVAMLTLRQIGDVFAESGVDGKYRTYASYDAGYIAYRSGWKIIDLQGLTTPEVSEQDVGTVVLELNPTVLIVSIGESAEPATIRLISRNGQTFSAIPQNYRFVKYLRLSNNYWWIDRPYGYAVFVNENADTKLIDGLQGISIDVEGEIGYQKLIYGVLEFASGFRL